MHLLVGRASQEQRKGVTLSVGFYYEFTAGLVSFESLHISKRQKKKTIQFHGNQVFNFICFLRAYFSQRHFII